jgi:hypothetical protein
MSTMHTPFVGIALARLRRGVMVCCWLIGLALVTQLLVWATAMFTDTRFDTIVLQVTAPMIVNQADKSSQPSAVGHASAASAVSAGSPLKLEHAANSPKPVDPNRVKSRFDRMMQTASTFSAGVGMLAVIALLPLLAVGATLGAGSATPGVEYTVSAFTWAIVLAMLMLPIGGVIGLPMPEGALYTYSNMTEQVDAAHKVGDGWAAPTFYARFAVLPMACVVAVTIIGLRFCTGVHAGLPVVESMKLDPVLEREAANITPTSLHGGRGATALRGVSMPPGGTGGHLSRQPGGAGAPAAPPAPSGPGMTQPSAGVAPRRLI